MSNKPSFDRYGYPTNESLEWLEEYNGFLGGQHAKWFEFAEGLWHRYGSVRRVKREGQNCIRFATGGWSGNEDVIDAMQSNHVMWSMTWYSSRRGGEHVFLLRKKARKTP